MCQSAASCASLKLRKFTAGKLTAPVIQYKGISFQASQRFLRATSYQSSLGSFAHEGSLKSMQVANSRSKAISMRAQSRAEASSGDMNGTRGIIFRQLFDTSGSCTYTYLLGDPGAKEAILIDPVLEMVERDLAVVDDLGLELKYVLNTHCHADHITGSGAIKNLRPTVKSMIAEASGARADIHLQPGETVHFGDRHIEARATPGHTDGCMTFVSRDNGGMAFTGDALLIRGCGRTDFQQGSAETLFDSVHSQIFSRASRFAYPAMITGRHHSTVLEEKTFNPRLTKSKEEFRSIMQNLGLPYPEKIDAAVPANMACGIQD
ncbi:hypothetical protein CYMTET_29827 [Cymbomonas tetramitiformis]|uniref:persulfide dioxygenase n=1 Tax=Cymbomonas tetramitiformis TaxID=36881 RepID=A0AAE0KUJ5_9CHLO|nr:hypothetical protein CYMTET_29827 [Cymbomonas tetramitiformis]